MSDLTTYDGLRASLLEWTEDDTSSELTAVLDRIILLGEKRILRDIDFSDFRQVSQTTTSASDPFLTVPGDFVLPRYMQVIDPINKSAQGRVEQKGTSFAHVYQPDREVTGKPRYFTQWDSGILQLIPTPDKAYTIELSYLKNPAGLSSTNQTTWISENAPDLLFFACLIEAAKFHKNFIGAADATIASWKESYAEALQRTSAQVVSRSRRDASRYGEVR